EGAADESDSARQEAELAQAAVTQAEAAARQASETLAQLRAVRAQTQRNAQETMTRKRNLAQQLAELESEYERVLAALNADQTVAERRDRLEGTQEAAEIAEANALEAEER